MKTKVFKTLFFTFLASQLVGYFMMFGGVVFNVGFPFSDFSPLDYLMLSSWLTLISLIIGGFFAWMGCAYEGLPLWTIAFPALFGIGIGLIFYLLFFTLDPKGPVHGSIGVVVLPALFFGPIGLLSFFAVVRIWNSK